MIQARKSPSEASSAIPFDTVALAQFLHSRISGLEGPMHIEKVQGGQSNPTYFVSFGPRRLVLRKRPPGTLLPSAHAVDREFRILLALQGTAVPVPKVHLLHEDESLIGTAFYVMDRVEGRIFNDSRLESAPKGERRAMYRSVADTLAAIHSVDFVAAGLSSFGKKGNFYERQVGRWAKQWSLSKTAENPDIDRLAEWLLANIPDDCRTTIVHGDFRIGNLIFHTSEPRIVAVLDWELSTLGHSLADLAHSCVYTWMLWPDEYGGVMGLDLEAEGLPTLQEFTGNYFRALGSSDGLGTFELALALFRNAVIFEGIAARARDGNAAATDAVRVGALAPVFARRGVAIIEGRSPER